MKEFKFENQGTNTFLVYHLQPEDELDTFSYGMISNNSIYGIVSTILVQMDNDKYLKFNVSSKISLEQYFTGVVNRQRFLNIFLNIATAILESEEYMLETSSFLLDPKYIYVNVGTEEAEIICFPILEKRQPIELVKFFKDIVFETQFDPSENADYVAKIISFLNGNNNFSLVDFKNLLSALLEKPKEVKEIKRESIQSTKAVTEIASAVAPPPISPPIQNIPNINKEEGKVAPSKFKFNLFGGNKGKEINGNSIKDKKGKEKKSKEKKGKGGGIGIYKMPVPEMPVPDIEEISIQSAPAKQPVQQIRPKPSAVQPSQRTSQSMGVQGHPTAPRPVPMPLTMNNIMPATAGETTVLNEVAAGETTVLSEQNPLHNMRPHLIRRMNNETVPINQATFKIGKERSFVDYCVGNNPTISRIHANIIRKGESFYIMDMNSKNRTYINETMIPSNTEVEISHGSMIRLANEEFEFKIR